MHISHPHYHTQPTAVPLNCLSSTPEIQGMMGEEGQEEEEKKKIAFTVEKKEITLHLFGIRWTLVEWARFDSHLSYLLHRFQQCNSRFVPVEFRSEKA